MSFLDQIKCFDKIRLKLVDTRVTTVCGSVVVERRDVEGTVSLSEAEQRGAGFVVDTKPDYQVACVTSHTSERLSFGSQDVAYCAELIKVNNITHVLSLIPTDSLDILYKSVDGIKHVVHKQIDVLDLPEFHIKDCLDECFEFINSGLIDKGHVFVHCNAGVSRSATVVIAYLMKFHHMSYLEAFQLVQRVRPVCRPNAGFDKQLREYETELKSITNIL